MLRQAHHTFGDLQPNGMRYDVAHLTRQRRAWEENMDPEVKRAKNARTRRKMFFGKFLVTTSMLKLGTEPARGRYSNWTDTFDTTPSPLTPAPRASCPAFLRTKQWERKLRSQAISSRHPKGQDVCVPLTLIACSHLHASYSSRAIRQSTLRSG